MAVTPWLGPLCSPAEVETYLNDGDPNSSPPMSCLTWIKWLREAEDDEDTRIQWDRLFAELNWIRHEKQQRQNRANHKSTAKDSIPLGSETPLVPPPPVDVSSSEKNPISGPTSNEEPRGKKRPAASTVPDKVEPIPEPVAMQHPPHTTGSCTADSLPQSSEITQGPPSEERKPLPEESLVGKETIVYAETARAGTNVTVPRPAPSRAVRMKLRTKPPRTVK